MERESDLVNSERRALLLALGATALTGLPEAAVHASQGEDQRLYALLDELFYERLQLFPEEASVLGMDTGSRAGLRSRLNDYSAGGRSEQHALTSRQLLAISRIDASKLSQTAALDREIVQYFLRGQEAALNRFPYGDVGRYFEPYVLSQLSGAYQAAPEILSSRHEIESAADADAYVARLSAFASALDQNSARQREDAGRGIVAPDFVLDTALTQLRKLRNAPARESALVAKLEQRCRELRLSDRFATRASIIVEKEIYPALDRQIRQCTELRARATPDTGAWRLPDGDAYYEQALKNATTTDIAVEEAHALGLEKIAAISSQMEALFAARGMRDGSIGQRLAALDREPAQLFENDDDGRRRLIEYVNELLQGMQARLSLAFAGVPDSKLEVRRVPPRIEDGATNGYYESAPLDRSRAAVYNINLRDTRDWPKYRLPTLSYHEGIPGHHLQIGFAVASSTIPLIRRRMPYAGYTEGWALYAEQLADELGAYDEDPPGRIGYLQAMLYRAVRLVVDTGIHVKRWSRDRGVTYMMDVTGLTRDIVEREVNRYCVWPGQACSYMVGQMAWHRLREQVKAKQGENFDLKRFHTVLERGPMPLQLLERVIGEA